MKNYFRFSASYIMLLVVLCITATQSNAQVNCKLKANFNSAINNNTYAISFHDLSTDSTAGATITSWLWNFGDTTTSAEQNPSHYFQTDSLPRADSIFNVCLTVTNSLGCTNTYCQQIVPYRVSQCQLTGNFTYSANSAGLTAFTDLSTDLTNGSTIASWLWKFDGTDSSTDENPTYQFSRGFHNVCLTVTNTFGCTSRYCTQALVNVNSNTCKLNAQFSFTSDSTGLANFQDLSTDSSAGGATITSWNWRFGGDSSGNIYSSLQNPSHLFFNGTFNLIDTFYSVCLTVTNSLGCSNYICKQIIIHKVNPLCNLHTDFSYTIDNTGNAAFHDLTTDATVGGGPLYMWNWDFGDNNGSYIPNPAHAYSSSGNYNVCLRVIDSLGCVSTACQQLTANITISSLCITLSADTTPGNNNGTEFYLIKAFNTANGDSLAVADTFITNQSYASHCFTNIPNGTYYAKATFTPGASNYATYLPTYYTNELLWNNATPLNLNGPQSIYLHLVQGNNNGGPGFIGGYVSQGANRLEQGASTNAVGDPEPGKTVILTTLGAAPVAHAVTDAQGHYQFGNLALGTYIIAIDILNKSCMPLQVTIDDSTGYKENGNFQVGSKSVSSQIVLSAETVNAYPFAVSLMGNPVGDELKLYLQNAPGDAAISITDLLGRKITSLTTAKETQVLKLNTQGMTSGVYLLTINSGSELRTLKFVKE